MEILIVFFLVFIAFLLGRWSAVADHETPEDRGAAERRAIADAAIAGMKDGSFYRDPSVTIAKARAKFHDPR